MGLFNKDKNGGILKVLKWDDGRADINEVIAYKHTEEDFNAGSQVIVHDSQEAIIMFEGIPWRTLPAGMYTIDGAHIVGMNQMFDWPYGGASHSHIEVYFVNKIFMTDLMWGTPNPIMIEDPIEGVNVHVGAHGLFGAHIEDSQYFLTKVVGTRDYFTKKELGEYLRGKIIEKVTDKLGKTMLDLNVGILQVSRYFTELSEEIKKQMEPYFEEFGIRLDNFSFNAINAPDEDLRAINESKIAAKKMDLESIALAKKRAREGYTYQQERGFDVLGTAAANEGASGTFMGAGMGLGMGVGMGGAFGGGMAAVARDGFAGMNQPNAQQAAQATVPCPNCNTPLPAGSKFCGNCGTKLVNTCPNCNTEIPAGAKFCGNCGTKLINTCPNCNAEVPMGTKFCGNCGTKI